MIWYRFVSVPPSIDGILLFCCWPLNSQLSSPKTQYIISLQTSHLDEKTWKYFSYFLPSLLSSQLQRKVAIVPCSWETSPWGPPTDMWRTRAILQEDWRCWAVAPGWSSAGQDTEVVRPVLRPGTAKWASATLDSHVSDRSTDGSHHVPGLQSEVYYLVVQGIMFGLIFIKNVFIWLISLISFTTKKLWSDIFVEWMGDNKFLKCLLVEFWLFSCTFSYKKIIKLL